MTRWPARHRHLLPRSFRLRARLLLVAFPIVLAALHLGAAPRAHASDWPQLGGPGRDYRPEAPPLATTWPEAGPKLLWRRDLGQGYSGIAVVGEQLFTLYREGEDEVVLAAGAKTGETLWEYRYGAPFASYMRMEHGTGPHVTPLVVGDVIFTAGIRGRLLALDRATGRVLWRRELVEELGGTEMDRGYASSPLAWRDLVIVPVGGQGEDFENSYSSPLLIELGGETQLVFLTRREVIGLDPSNGRRLFSHPHPTMYGLNIAVPVWSDDDLLFVSSAYDGGSRVLHLVRRDGATSVEELWAHKRMRLHIGNAIRVGDVVYASNGDFGPVPFTAVNAKTGEILWRSRQVSRATLLLADQKLILLDEDGVLYLASVSPTGIEIHARHDLFEGRAWTPPTLVSRTLYARDTQSMVALELP